MGNFRKNLEKSFKNQRALTKMIFFYLSKKYFVFEFEYIIIINFFKL